MNQIFKAIVGSQSYGTTTPESDVDYKGVYIQSNDEILSFKYKEQIEVSKDECYYEVRRFLQLLQSANPTVLELLYTPEDCIIYKHPVFDILINHRDKFLTKKCLNSFGGYAIAQIQKAKGLDKKMNWEKTRVERKGVLDFCFVMEGKRSVEVIKWLKSNNYLQERCGLSEMPNWRYTYNLFYDHLSDVKNDNPRYAEIKTHEYKGIVQDVENSNDISLSSIPEYAQKETILYFNKDGYSHHCKEYREFKEWLSERNTARYVDLAGHNQKIDGKNLLHCRRLLDMAMEIAKDGVLNIRRPNAEYLLQIRKGKVELQSIIDQAEIDIRDLNGLYANSLLPDDVDPDFLNSLLLEVRNSY